MKNRIFSKEWVLVACFVLIVSSLTFVGTLRAQPFPPALWPVPRDTTHFIVTNWTGRPDTVRRPPDSTMVPSWLDIRFRPGMLDSGILSETYYTFFYGHGAKHKGTQPQGVPTGPYSDSLEPRGFWPALRSMLFAEHFGLDSSNNIVKDTLLRNFMVANGCHYLHRFTAASPLDTLTITTQGDTIPCDLPNWMVLSFDSNVNPLYLAYLLEWNFPNDIAMEYPSYYAGQLYGQPSDVFYTLGYQLGIPMIEADTAWNFETGDTNIIVEVADAGLDYRHPDFGDSVVGPGHKWEATWDYDTNSSITYADNPDHGTAMAGILGALSNNAIGDYAPYDTSVAGIAGGRGGLPKDVQTQNRGVTLAGYVTNIHADGDSYWYSSIFEAASKSPNTPFGLGAQVINCSEGFPVARQFEEDEFVHAALNYAFINGVTFAAAVPDDGSDSELNYPSDYEDPWVISVGGSWNQTDREKQPGSDYGYTLDLIAPDGAGDPTTEPNPYILNYTTRKLSYSDPFTYGAYGGTSASTANVSGSAALLLSHYFKIDSLVGIEPEDIQNILKASAWRGDTQRIAHPELSHSWVPNNGYGHLDIGHAFEMLDTNIHDYPDAGYKLYHASAITIPVLDTGTWVSLLAGVQFSPPWQYTSEGDTFSVPLTPMLPYDLVHGHYARYRTLTFTYTLPVSLENSDTCPLFVWGRSGGAGRPSGWSYASNPNYETGWTKVANGLGSDPDSLMDGIFAPSDGIIKLETVQYDVYGWVDSTGSYSHYYAHCPPDPQVGVNFSYFGRPKPPMSIVQESPNLGSDSLMVSVNSEGTIVDTRFFTVDALSGIRLEFRDILGRIVYSDQLSHANSGWNEIKIPSSSMAGGAYFCIVSNESYFHAKDFLLLK